MATADDQQKLIQALQLTLDADKKKRKEAEDYLESIEASPTYGLQLLHLLEDEKLEAVVRSASSIMFKNFIKRNWRILEDQPNKINETDRKQIKDTIVELMLTSPESLQRQLSDAISIIGREDFPTKWEDLMGKMTSFMKNHVDNLHIVNGVLQTAHSLFKKFRYEFKSQGLWEELKFVLDSFAAPLLELYEALLAKLPAALNDAASLKPVIEVLIIVCKLFYSLNYQDLPENFEDNMKRWMDPFHEMLTAPFKVLESDDKEEAGPIEQLRSQICDNVALYAQKYDEDFQPHLPIFVSAIWNLLTTTSQDLKYDLLVSNAIQFLASVCERPHYKDLFKDQATLISICEKVVVPNMMFRDEDEELFEDNPEEYIHKDMEGSDIDTRRRAASDLVRGLCKYYEQAVTEIFSHYVVSMLAEYKTNPANWKSKDAAIYLVTSLAAKKSTSKLGTTESSELVDLNDFFLNNVLIDLKADAIDELPVLKADAIKYVITFRNMLPRETLLLCLPCVVELLRSKSNVVHSYAACAIEKLLLLKSPGGGAPFSGTELAPQIMKMLKNLFDALDMSGSNENEYVMKAIMRCCLFLQSGVAAYVDAIIDKLSSKLQLVCKNPSKPQFNHFLFETICALIRGIGKSDKSAISKVEKSLFPIMDVVLREDVTEFIPYMFQVLSLALSNRVEGVHGVYLELYPLLLQPMLWEKQGNIPALTKLLQAYLKRGATAITTGDQLLSLMGVFQKLIASRTHDHEGFHLLSSIVENLAWPQLEPVFKQVMLLLFQRLSTSKTVKYVKGYTVFVNMFAGLHSPVQLQQTIDEIQPQLFGMMVDKVFLENLQKISGGKERKICAVGVTRLLTEVPAFLDTAEYVAKWPPLLQALVGMFELPEDDTVPEDEQFVDVDDTAGYQNAFSRLAFGSTHECDVDPFATIPDVKEFLAKQLYRLSIERPGKLKELVARIDQGAANYLQAYLTKAQVQLA